MPPTAPTSAPPPDPQNGSASDASQYRPNLNQAPQGDFMRPAARTRASSRATTNGVGVQVEDTRICVVMVGLPARGKSLIAQKGETYISHTSFTQCFGWHGVAWAMAAELGWHGQWQDAQETIYVRKGVLMRYSRPLPRLALHNRQMLQRRLLPPHRDPTTLRLLLRLHQQRRRAPAPRRRRSRGDRHDQMVQIAQQPDRHLGRDQQHKVPEALDQRPLR